MNEDDQKALDWFRAIADAHGICIRASVQDVPGNFAYLYAYCPGRREVALPYMYGELAAAARRLLDHFGIRE